MLIKHNLQFLSTRFSVHFVFDGVVCTSHKAYRIFSNLFCFFFQDLHPVAVAEDVADEEEVLEDRASEEAAVAAAEADRALEEAAVAAAGEEEQAEAGEPHAEDEGEAVEAAGVPKVASRVARPSLSSRIGMRVFSSPAARRTP